MTGTKQNIDIKGAAIPLDGPGELCCLIAAIIVKKSITAVTINKKTAVEEAIGFVLKALDHSS